MTLARKIAAILALAAAAAYSQSARYVIAGVTVEHKTKQPVPRVLMTIMMTDGSRRQKACITDASGRFRFAGIPAGKYILNANRPGGFPQSFEGSGGFVTGIAVGPGRDSEHIVFELRAGATIAGTVMDDDGEPVRQAQVYLFRKAVVNGMAGIHIRGVASTNASGRFHFDRLPTGTYLAGVAAQPWFTRYQSTAPGSEMDVAYPVSYYADVTDPASASPIKLVEGGSANIQITLHAVPAGHISLDLPPNQRAQGISRRISAIGPGGFPIGMSLGTYFINGNSESVGLAPGDYTLTLQTLHGGNWATISRKFVSIQSGSDPEIKDEVPASLTGKLVFTPPDKPPGIGIAILPFSGGRRHTAKPPSDGSFQFAGISPGRYRIALTNAPGFRITQVTAKGAAYASGLLKIAPGTGAQLSIVAARAESHVDGIALKDGKPFPGAMILLLPLDVKTNQYVGRDQSDSDGTFSVLHVPNGRYVLLAIDDGRDFAYRDPTVIAPYRSGGLLVNVPATNGSKLKVKVLSRRK